MKLHRHRFLLELQGSNGHSQRASKLAIVRTPRSAVTIDITEDAVLRSMKLKGVGNTMTCTVACGLADNAKVFSHPVVGLIDFFHTTCFVASKLKDGLPSECYRYVHNFRWVAELNDAKGGQQQLLEIIRRDGPITVTLRPRRRTDRTKKGGTGRRDGTRSTRLIGARLRHANATAGLSLPESAPR